jgi:hypothetical protein
MSLFAELSFDSHEIVSVTVTKGAGLSHQVVYLADQLQDWAVENLWEHRRSPVWPVCPDHPDSHPMRPSEDEGRAVWLCPATSRLVAEIGLLTP